ncbi:MAG: NUDIX domain-containing protein [Candidatus Daviesbacteria bacterium]|nr:NUDIX domain-containing protein [Candidatus Daviesbacteria bacterium]
MKKGVDYIGVTCVFFCHDGKGNLLMHKRSQNCKDERGNWDVGGGSLEFGESFEEGVLREIKEEYCCDVLDLKFVEARNVLRVNHENKKTHWVALLFAVKVNPKQVKLGEPEKMDEIGWFSEKNWPNPIHSYFQQCYDAVKPYLK